MDKLIEAIHQISKEAAENLKEIIKTLPDEEIRAALEYDNPARKLSSLFTWSDTKQGYSYWNDIFNQLYMNKLIGAVEK
jgi:uncharacterized protein YjgD (DUF1641 family)